MTEATDLFDLTSDGIPILRLHVQPGAGRSAITGRHGTALKVRVAAPPEGGRANQACLELLARELGVEKGAVELVGGQTSRAKRVKVNGVDGDELDARLRLLLTPGKPGAR